MANSLDFAGLVIAAVDLARKYDTDPYRSSRYESVIADISAATQQHEGALTYEASEEIFAKHALPTIHITAILRGL